MQANEPVTIRRAQNGFIVFGVANTHTTEWMVDADTMVFNRMVDLQLFLSSHFKMPDVSNASKEAELETSYPLTSLAGHALGSQVPHAGE